MTTEMQPTGLFGRSNAACSRQARGIMFDEGA
jgi:hypothetical protein